MSKKVIINLFPRNKYPSTVSGRVIHPRDRAKVASMLGGADEVWVHTRVYLRDTNVRLDFAAAQGCLGSEPPSEGLRTFTLPFSNMTPGLPYDSTNMPNIPDDAAFSFSPKMGLVDLEAKVYNAAGSIEFETWATLIFND